LTWAWLWASETLSANTGARERFGNERFVDQYAGQNYPGETLKKYSFQNPSTKLLIHKSWNQPKEVQLVSVE
jgi:hypothetical protein